MPADSDTSSLYTLPESLRESLYRIKGQRRHQALAGPDDYPWPCDGAASQLELLFAAICGDESFENGLHWERSPGHLKRKLASSDGQARILDLGSGMTATWCLSMAERYPEAEVIGVDLIPCELSYLPPNLSTEIHDLLEGLPFPDDYFDLIHCRDGGFATFMESNRIDMLSEIARALKPGGVASFETLQNIDDPFCSDDPSNPVLLALRHRHESRIELLVQKGLDIMSPRAGLSERLKFNDAFRHEGIATVTFVLPLGAKPEDGPAGKHLGAISRDTWLLFSELCDAAAGLDEAVIRALKQVDQLTLPVEYRGVWLEGTMIWAEKKLVGEEL